MVDHVTCPGCNLSLRVPEDFTGTLLRCPACSRVFNALADITETTNAVGETISRHQHIESSSPSKEHLVAWRHLELFLAILGIGVVIWHVGVVLDLFRDAARWRQPPDPSASRLYELGIGYVTLDLNLNIHFHFMPWFLAICFIASLGLEYVAAMRQRKSMRLDWLVVHFVAFVGTLPFLWLFLIVACFCRNA